MGLVVVVAEEDADFFMAAFCALVRLPLLGLGVDGTEEEEELVVVDDDGVLLTSSSSPYIGMVVKTTASEGIDADGTEVEEEELVVDFAAECCC